jgi:hypothetical protein
MGSLFTSYLPLTPFRPYILIIGIGGPLIAAAETAAAAAPSSGMGSSWGPMEIYGGHGTCISIDPHRPT